MVETIFIKSKWEGDTSLDKKALEYIKNLNIGSIAIFSSVQFETENIEKQLLEIGITTKKTKARRTSNIGQILGCDAYQDSFQEPIIQESDLILYVGDGLFHPKALLLSQMNNEDFKNVVTWNPISKRLSILDKEIILKQIQRKKRNLRMFLNSEKIGILVTIKIGQQYLNSARRLKKHLQKQGKKAYIFIDNTLDLRHLENYPFIQAWVNTGCPRIGLDDITSIQQPLINLKEAFNPVAELDKIKD